jgi:hypothetical protein
VACLTNDNAVVECVQAPELGVTDMVGVANLTKPMLRASGFTKAVDSFTA